MNSTRIRIGIVGAGIAAVSAHLPILTQSEDFEVVSLCDTNRERLEFVAREWHISHAYCEMGNFLQAPGLEAVVIATPPDSHLPLALACIDAGMHLLVEKPLAANMKESAELVACARKKGVRVAVNHEKRFHPTFEHISRLLQDGAIGRPFFAGVHWASNVKLAPDSFIPTGFGEGYRWRWSNREIGGGIVQDHLPHYVDLVSYWTGTIPTAVYAEVWNVGKDLLSWPSAESVWEDMGLVLTRFSSGFVLRLETGTVGRSLSPLWSLGSGIGEWTEYGYILGTSGQLLFDLLPWDSSENGRIALWQLGRAQQEHTGWAYVEQTEPRRRQGSPAGAAREMFGAQLGDFARFLRGQKTRIATAEDGLGTMAAVEAAYRSAATRVECPVERAMWPDRIPNNKEEPSRA